MCISYVRPLLEYCDSVWDNASVESNRQLDDVHIEAARIITGATKSWIIKKLLHCSKCLKEHCVVVFFLFFAIDNNTNSESWLIRQTHVCPVFSLVTYQGRCLLIKIK